MAFKDFVYACPHCAAEPIEGSGERLTCRACGLTVRRNARGRIELRTADGAVTTVRAAEVLKRLRGQGTPDPEHADRSAPIPIRSAAASLSALEAPMPARYRGRLTGWVERPGSEMSGELTLDAKRLSFTPADADDPSYQWDLSSILGLQVASKALQITTGNPLQIFNLRISSDSVLRWEDLLQSRIRAARAPHEVLEFQPRIVTDDQARRIAGRTPVRSPSHHLPTQAASRSSSRAGFPLYMPARALFGGILRTLGPLEVEGLEHVPTQGPALLLPNHVSWLDPVAVQVACRRRVRALTKSTQFRGATMNWLLHELGAIPVRRYQPDLTAIRQLLRLFSEGEVVAIYPEGERSWDGTLGPFRRGTLRLISAIDVPVIPVGVRGSFERWPRWSKQPRRVPIQVRFGAPLVRPLGHTRAERERLVPTLAERLAHELTSLTTR